MRFAGACWNGAALRGFPSGEARLRRKKPSNESGALCGTLRPMTLSTAPTSTTSPPSWCNDDDLNRVSSLADPLPGAQDIPVGTLDILRRASYPPVP